MSVNGLNLSDCSSGIVLKNTKDSIIANCVINGTKDSRPDIDVDSSNRNIRLSDNLITGRAALPKK